MITTDLKWSMLRLLNLNDHHWLEMINTVDFKMMNTDFEYLSHQDTIQGYQACLDCLQATHYRPWSDCSSGALSDFFLRSSLVGVYTVYHFLCFFWMHYCMVKHQCSNFTIIKAIFFHVRIFSDVYSTYYSEPDEVLENWYKCLSFFLRNICLTMAQCQDIWHVDCLQVSNYFCKKIEIVGSYIERLIQ